MSGRFIVGVGSGILLIVLSASPAMAQYGGFGYFGYGGYGMGGINEPHLPYYALFPPVYYSYPVARTYGYSPFAYPPGVMTPDASPSVPVAAEYRNPYVPSNDPMPSGPMPSSESSAAVGKIYVNPFVVSRAASVSIADNKTP